MSREFRTLRKEGFTSASAVSVNSEPISLRSSFTNSEVGPSLLNCVQGDVPALRLNQALKSFVPEPGCEYERRSVPHFFFGDCYTLVLFPASIRPCVAV